MINSESLCRICINSCQRLAAVLFAFLLLPASLAVADRAEEDALRWLAVVDEGEYEESWSQAAPVFRDSISEASWVSTANSVRSPLGAFESRILVQRSDQSSLPGAPEGSYVAMIYATAFASKKSTQETVILMFVGANWQVAGYFVK